MIRWPGLKKNLYPDIIACFLIFLFVYTAINKLIDIKSFETTLSLSPYLRSTASLLAWCIPFSELLIAFLLFMPLYRHTGLLLGSVLMGLFIIYIGFMISVSKGLPCTCGGVISKMSWSRHLVFNSVVFIMAISAWKLRQRQIKILLQ